ncbi:hypothetical protein BHM03_00012373 [Ensete ventricosum]|nr:hypothetical protein BHM03_00012373 [Ensete ventricosum]
MFGFVTFVYPETVRLILAKGNPHFVCDARVLVKPYKEKGKVPDNNGSGGSSSSSQEHSPTGGADQKMNSSNGFLEKKTVDPADKKESDAEANPNKDSDIHESAEHILPDSPFASPTKSSIALDPFSAAEADIAATSAAIVNNGSSSSNAHLSPSTLLPSTSTIDMASYKSCFFQMPR